MNISAFFIRNPIPGILLFVLLSIAGIFGYSQMTVKLFPDVDVPFIVVTVPMPGASPTQLENEVARKIENKLASLAGLKNIHTTLVDNAATIIAEFELEKPVQEAVDDVRSAVSEVRSDLPPNAEAPIIVKLDIREQPLFIYSISSTSLDAVDLSWYVENDLSKDLLGVKGVGAINRIGGVKREVQVLLDPTTLQAYQTTVSNVSRQIKNMQQNFSGGEADFGGLKQPIRTIAAVQKPEELQDLSITLSNGRIVKLKDVAEVKDTYAEQQSKAILDGQEGVAFIVQRALGYGDVDVGKSVQARLEQIREEQPHLTITEVFETMSLVEQDYSGAMDMLLEGAILAVFVVLLFLGGMRPTLFLVAGVAIAYYVTKVIPGLIGMSLAGVIVVLPIVFFFDRFRATLVAATALPLSLLPAFAGMYFLGISFNLMVTLALSLVIGILVDDAIVEIENIDQHINRGKTPFKASIEAADEIGTAVIAITSTLIAVFLPTAFMPGVAGKFFYQFGVAASLSIFSSLLVARIITPMMCAYFLVPHKHEVKDPFWMKPYLWFAKWALKLRWITLLGALSFFYLSLVIMGQLPKGFIPPNNGNFTQVNIELPPGGRLDKTETIAIKAKEAIEDITQIQRIFTYVGEKGVRKASLFITLVDRSQRPDTNKQVIENEIRHRLENVAGARFTVRSGGNGERYQMTLSSPNPTDLANATEAIVSDLRTIPELGSVSNSAGLVRQELIVYPDYTKAAERGVSTAAIAQTMRVATIGDYRSQLPKFNSDERQVPIVVRLPDSAKSDVSILNDLVVMGSKGPVRIGDVAKIDVDTGPLSITRKNRSRNVNLSVEIKYGELGEIQDKITNLPSVKNLPTSVKQLPSGDAEIMIELAINFVIAMGVGVLCIYLVLILLFGQVAQPITILFAMFLSVGGAVGGLIIVNAGMTLPAMIGFLMLMGIAVKNSILLVEYTIEKRRQNPDMKRSDAVIDACHKRARPIIMTTIAMGAGMLPLIIGIGEADPTFRRPMAAAVFGGLLSSTILSLVVIPAVYTIVEDTSRVLGWFARFGKPKRPGRRELEENLKISQSTTEQQILNSSTAES